MNYSESNPTSTSYSRHPAAECSREERPVPSIAAPFPTVPLEAAGEYVRQGMVVVPQRSPEDGHSGKESTIKGFKGLGRKDMTSEFIQRHFSHSTNIGLLLQDDHVVIDLDSKHDQGDSARAWYQEHPELHPSPLERTGNGLHLHFRCSDVPEEFRTGRRAVNVKLESAGGKEVVAELFLSGMKVTVAPSLHENGTKYCWEKAGELPVVPWEKIERIFGFAKSGSVGTSGRKSRTRKGSFSGDLGTIDVVALFREAGLYGKLIDQDEGKHSVNCPFAHEHSDGGKEWTSEDTSCVIFEGREDKQPAFKCLHTHCDKRRMADAVAEVERVHPEITTRHTKEPARPKIQLPGPGRTQSEFAREIALAIAASGQFFSRGDALVEVKDSSLRESGLPNLSITETTAIGAITRFEAFADFGKKTDGGFREESPQERDMRVVLASRQIKECMPPLTGAVAIPIPALHEGRLVYPSPGYNPATGLYLSKGAVWPVEMKLREAIEEIDQLLGNGDGGGFCWKSEQDRINAIARLVTPYCRLLMSWSKAPLFVITGNQPRVGKDQFANLVHRLYTGRDCTGAPLDKGNDAEMRKRITSSLKSSSLFIHLANMKGHVHFPSLESATDSSSTFTDRELGSNRSLELRNTAEYSLSLNLGTTLTPDLQGRALMIQLSFSGEDPNTRRFRIPNLGTYVENRRGRILGACDAFVRNWHERGCPQGPNPFASFPEWAATMGGILTAAGIGDPCLRETAGDFDDYETSGMKRLYQAAYEKLPEQQVDKAKLYELVQSLPIFHNLDLSTSSGKTQLGKLMSRYDGREFVGVRMTIIKSDPNRIKYVFRKSEGPGNGGGTQTLQTSQTLEPLSSMGNEAIGSPEQDSDPTTPTNAITLEVCNVCADQVLSRSDLKDFIAALGTRGGGSVVIALLPREPNGDGRHDLRAEAGHRIRFGGGKLAPVIIDPEKDSDSDLRLFLGRLCDYELIGHDLKRCLAMLKVPGLGISPSRLFCTRVAARLLSVGQGKGGDDFESVSRRYLGSSRSGECHPDVDLILDLAAELKRQIPLAGLEKVAALEMELVLPVVRMEAHGCPVDTEELARRKGAQTEGNSPDAGFIKRIEDGVTSGSRVHATFDSLGAVTGRFSCSKPSLQNIPRGEVRRIIAAPEGKFLVRADYSQAELRVAAALSEDARMIEAFRKGEDLHVETAALILGKSKEAVTDEERNLGKAVNFGFLFGQGPKGFVNWAQSRYGVSVDAKTAASYRRRFFEAYPGLKRWQEDHVRTSQDTLESRTMFGRRIILDLAENGKQNGSLLNHPIQGTAADALKFAMLVLDGALPSHARIVLVIHDEIVVEVEGDREEADSIGTMVRDVMEDAMEKVLHRRVPVAVKLSVGRSLAE